MSVILGKEKTISLSKKDGSPISSIVFGFGWEAASAGNKMVSSGKMKLTAAAIIIDEHGAQIANIDNKQNFNKSVTYIGKGLADIDDDQRIIVKVKELQQEKVYLCLISEKGEKFTNVQNVYVRGIAQKKDNTEQEIFRYNIFQTFSSTAEILVKIEKRNDQWTLETIDRFVQATLPEDVVRIIELLNI